MTRAISVLLIAFAAGCGGQVQGGGSDGGAGTRNEKGENENENEEAGAFPSCPEDAPPAGSACTGSEGCAYYAGRRCEGRFICDGGHWREVPCG